MVVTKLEIVAAPQFLASQAGAHILEQGGNFTEEKTTPRQIALAWLLSKKPWIVPWNQIEVEVGIKGEIDAYRLASRMT